MSTGMRRKNDRMFIRLTITHNFCVVVRPQQSLMKANGKFCPGLAWSRSMQGDLSNGFIIGIGYIKISIGVDGQGNGRVERSRQERTIGIARR